MVERKRYQDYEMVYHKKLLCYIHKFIASGQTEKNFEAKKSPCADEEALTSSKNQILRSNMETLDSTYAFFVNRILPKKPELSKLGMFLIESSMQRNTMCRLAGVGDVVVADATSSVTSRSNLRGKLIGRKRLVKALTLKICVCIKLHTNFP